MTSQTNKAPKLEQLPLPGFPKPSDGWRFTVIKLPNGHVRLIAKKIG